MASHVGVGSTLTMLVPLKAADIAKRYSEAATWVPCKRAMPPANEIVDVLYADGIVDQCAATSSGSGLFLDSAGNYRYVDVLFWKPIQRN